MLLVYIKAIDFCKLILYHGTLLNLFIAYRSILVDVLETLMSNIISSANKGSFTCFPVYVSLIFFSCLMTLSSALSTILKRSGDIGHSYLFPDFSWTASSSSFFPFWMMILAVSFSCTALIMLRVVPFSPSFSRTFIMKGCWFLSTFPCIY